MLILPKASNAVTKEFPKAISTYIKGFPNAAENFMKKSPKNCYPRRFEKPVCMITRGILEAVS
jgi:hypothetical protein